MIEASWTSGYIHQFEDNFPQNVFGGIFPLINLKIERDFEANVQCVKCIFFKSSGFLKKSADDWNMRSHLKSSLGYLIPK